MNFEHYKELYQSRLPVGQKFQDHCAVQIMKNLNIPLVNLQSKEFQFEIGENLQGFEIKYDQNFVSTNNLYIETEHRVSPEQEYYKGGIFREDNSWLYCIGNYEIIYIFPKNLLILLYNSGRYPVIENNLMTSKGFLLPKHDADKYAATKIATKSVVNETAGVKSEKCTN
jgi:hypothetical protein